MPRFPLLPFIRGLSTLADPAAGDPQASPDCQDVRGHRGLLTCRKGFRVLATEPSHKQTSNDATKVWGYLGFDGVNDYATNAAWTQTLGTKWTVRFWDYALSLSGINNTDGTRTLLHVKGTTHDPLLLQIVGVTAGGGTAQIKAVVKDAAGNTVTLTGTARTTTAWVTLLGQHGVAYIRVVRDGATVSLFVGETQEDTDTGFTLNAHEPATELWLGATGGVGPAPVAGTYAHMQVLGLSIVNRVLTEYESYWGIGWPMDAEAEVDVLGNWPFIERTGSTIKDYSLYADDLTITGATFTGALQGHARGLGIFSWRRANGDILHAIACTRRGTSSTGASPSGAFYTWKADKNFTPFYFQNDPGADDASAVLSGLDPFARVDFQQGRDMLLIANGVDYNRKYSSLAQYMSGTAPPTAPVLSLAAASPFTYAYSYFNSITKTETGLSPGATASAATGTIAWAISSDTQFDRVRLYRSKTGEANLYLVTEQAMGTGGPYTDATTDAQLVGAPLCPGSDIPGNRARKRAYLGFPDFPLSETLLIRRNYSLLMGLKAPATALTVGNSAGGSLSAGAYYVAYSYYDSTNDVETGMSPAATHSAATVAASDKLDLSGMVLPPEGSRYDQIRIYRTKAWTSKTAPAAAGSAWYLDQTITAATTATSSQADSTLDDGSVTIETRALPPKFEGMCVFANRLWGFTGPNLHWSTWGFFEDHPEANGFSPKAGVKIRAIAPTEGAMFVHFEDGTMHVLPHPGEESDLSYFILLNLRQFSPRNAAVGHFTVQAVPGGLVWLARDGFYFGSPSGVQLISPQISPEFLDLNSARGKYACSLYDGTRGIYRCWLSRGNKRLNEECFVCYLREGTWWLDNLHADAAGILYDGKQNPHYCFLVENGILMELDESLDYDGDGSGTLSGAVAAPTLSSFTDILSRTAPVGGDGGYPINLLSSAGVFVRRTKLDPAMDPRGDVDGVEIFYPSYKDLSTSYTAYFHGIRGYLKTMILHFRELRFLKNIKAIFFFNRVQSAGGLQVNLSTDESALAAVNSDVDLTKAVSQVTSEVGSGRAFQLEFYSDPPAASRPWGLKGVEFEGSIDEADVGT